jgi:polyisoprenoid-binding protein YceI
MKNIYQIDPAHSNVQFSVRHLMLSNVRGTFSGVTGTVIYDPAKPEATSVEAKVDVHTVNTNDEKRDGHLKSPDFFDAAAYPTMTFASKRVEKTGTGEFKVTGDLTIHGVTREVALTAEEVTEESNDPWGKVRIGASIKGKIKRADFGVTWNSALEAGGVVIGDEVKLEFDLQLVKAESATA